ncbi:MAG TPA: ribonuclease G [Firmicutes bacterium]|nr:ribonuclease G [Bacillota bacterium]
MSQVIVINAGINETRVAILENGLLGELAFERADDERVVGNIYRGKVENVLPGMEAAFVNIGLDRNAFLYVDDIIRPKSIFECEDDTPEIPKGKDKDKDKDKDTPNISSLLKEGQDLLVQVIKEPIGTKGARVVTQLTIAGRYLVLMPNVDYVGVSRRIVDEKERERLRAMAGRLKPAGCGVIVRTVAEGIAEDELAGDLNFLLNAWRRIHKKTRRGRTPQLLYRDHDLVYRIMRDFFTDDIDEIVVDHEGTYKRCLEMAKVLAPSFAGKIALYRNEQPIFDFFGISSEIERALKRKVWLSCGGDLVIDQTEALTVIDVNTGKFIGRTSLEDTVVATNLEAAREIARQMHLRNLAGIIIIDFIDMIEEDHREEVIRVLGEALKSDKTKSNILGFTALGLLEVTRKKVRQGLVEYLTDDCPNCGGTGKVFSKEALASQAEREIRKIVAQNTDKGFLFHAHPSVASLLIGPGGSNLVRLEEELRRIIYIRGHEGIEAGKVQLITSGTKDKVEKAALPVAKGDIIEVEVREPHLSNPGDGIGRIEGYVIDIEDGAQCVGNRVRVRIDKAYRTYAKGKMIH